MWRKLWALLNTPIGKLLARKAVEVATERAQEFLAPAVMTASVARHVPRPGTAVVEVYDIEHKLLTMDTVKAPPGVLDGLRYTNVVVPSGPVEYRHVEFEVNDAEALPFKVPAHLWREDAALYKVWWSQEEARTDG